MTKMVLEESLIKILIKFLVDSGVGFQWLMHYQITTATVHSR
jgi:hypothetical protein